METGVTAGPATRIPGENGQQAVAQWQWRYCMDNEARGEGRRDDRGYANFMNNARVSGSSSTRGRGHVHTVQDRARLRVVSQPGEWALVWRSLSFPASPISPYGHAAMRR
jgi:hypothetical protein